MSEITITCTWRSTHVVEVPDGFVIPHRLSDFPEEALEELTAENAELLDWE